ncbi:MAG TPA: PAS domain S-box protein [Chthoniobacterales bacterium]
MKKYRQRAAHSYAMVRDVPYYDFQPSHGFSGRPAYSQLMTTLPSENIADAEAHDLNMSEAWRLAAIVESSDDAIISKDLDGTIVTWNSGATRLFGYTAKEAIGQSITVLIPADRQGEEPEILRRILHGERIDHFQTVRRRKNGSLVEVSLTVSPIKDSTGCIIGASKIARDITDIKVHEAALKAALDAAEAANSSKDRFLAMLSHELRTPLTPALAAAAVLEADDSLPVSVREDIGTIRRSIETEAKLIDDLLDLSRMKSGKFNLQKESVDPNEIIRRACDICHLQIVEKGIRLEQDLDPEVGPLFADPARLEQVFWNLVQNAAKFTPVGGTISIKSKRRNGKWQVEIRDTGIGIEPDFLLRLFTPFEQARPAASNSGGLGLGLAIAKALVELHGGSICAHSSGAGQGSLFTIEIPERSPPEFSQKAILPDGKTPAQQVRILLVEDHPDTARTLQRLLQRAGYVVEIANDAAVALELARKGAFDILLSDLGLPDASGSELMRRLREQSSIKGIALSGYGTEEDQRTSRMAGFEEHLVKPVDLVQLQQSIARVLRL